MKTIHSKLALLGIVLLVPGLAAADTGKSKQDLVLEYLDYIGVIESIELSTETMRMDYEEYYAFVPDTFWEDPRVEAAFDNYKVSLLRGYTEALTEELSDEELDFLIEFYASEEGKRVIAIGRRLDPLMVAANSEAGGVFADELSYLLEYGDE